MGLLGMMLAGGVAEASKSISSSIDNNEKAAYAEMLERYRQQHQEHLAELQNQWTTERDKAQFANTTERDKAQFSHAEAMAEKQNSLRLGAMKAESEYKDANTNVAFDNETKQYLTQSEVDARKAAGKEDSITYLSSLEIDKQQQDNAYRKEMTERAKAGGDRGIIYERRRQHIEETIPEGPERDKALMQLDMDMPGSKGGASKGRWIQDASGEWRQLTGGDTAQGVVKETVKENDDGTFSIYDPVSDTTRISYPKPLAEKMAREQAEQESDDAGEGLFNSKWDQAKINKRAKEIETELLNQSKRPGRQESKGENLKNNVGSLRDGKDGFQQFKTAEEGVAAMDANIKSYKSKYKVDTLRDFISTWSPPSENDTERLISDAEKMTGIKRDQKIDLDNPAVRTMLAAAVIRQEGNKAYLSGIGKGQKSSSSGVESSQEAEAATPMPKNKSELVEGQVYATPRGNAIWKDGQFTRI